MYFDYLATPETKLLSYPLKLRSRVALNRNNHATSQYSLANLCDAVHHFLEPLDCELE
jgi:hypothetical protein